jgi:LmbE family N-acetylglucosaminyl deacetylase
MSKIRTPADVKQLGTILAVWAHPDDESFCAAGLLASAAANGQRVICLTFTKGEAGVQDESRWPAKELGKIRDKELADGLELLGIKDHHCLDYADGGCAEVSDAEGAAAVKAFIETHQPDTILTFGPDGLTGHPDHQAVSRWVDQAVQGSKVAVYHFVEEAEAYEKYMKQLDKKFNFYFNIDKPPLRKAADCDIALHLTPELCAKKCAALQAMPSQTERLFNESPEGFMMKALAYECYELAP